MPLTTIVVYALLGTAAILAALYVLHWFTTQVILGGR